MLYMIAPIVYDNPLAASQNMPSGGRLLTNGFIAIIIIHPINTYIDVDSILYFPVKNSFKTIPAKAIPHKIPNSVHPSGPRSVTSI